MEVLCLYVCLEGLKVPAGPSWDFLSRANGTQRKVWLTGSTLKHSTGWKRSAGVRQNQKYLFYETDRKSLWILSKCQLIKKKKSMFIMKNNNKIYIKNIIYNIIYIKIIIRIEKNIVIISKGD